MDLPADQFGRTTGRCVTRWTRSSRCVPDVVDQDAFDPSGFISRSSDRGNTEPGSAWSPHATVNWTASITRKAGVVEAAQGGLGHLLVLPVGRFSLQGTRLSTWDGLTKTGTKVPTTGTAITAWGFCAAGVAGPGWRWDSR